jgi:hypothetical protein
MEAHAREVVRRPPATRIGPVRLGRPTEPAARAASLGLALTLAVVLTGGLGAYLTFGPVPHGGFDPAGLVDHLGAGRDALVAPFARWDSVWYLAIARDGYVDGSAGTAFFPLYPLLVALVAQLGPGVLGAGVLVSVVCLFVALRLLWRLTDLELGGVHPEAARLAVLACALGPMAFFLTAIYSESLFLALSLGAFLAARQGRWAQAAGLGALGAATRSQGILLLGALALLYVEQRRGVPPPARPEAQPGLVAPRPRRRDALWLLVVPLGLGAYLGWLGLVGLDPLAPFTAQQAWFRHFAGPLGGVGQAASAALGGAHQLLSGQTRTIYFRAAGGDPMVAAWHNLMLFGFLLAALPALVAALRRLPLAYGAYALAAIVLAVSYPAGPEPLMSLPRFLVVLFPLQMAIGLWLAGHERLRRPVLGTSAAMLASFAGLFATWHWIA